jgi:hypothetical protein
MPHPARALRVVTPVRVEPFRRGAGHVGGTTEHCGCADGRPRRWGTPVLHEPSLRGAPRNYPVVGDPSPDGDHQTVAMHATRRARPLVREVKASISQRAHGIGHWSHPATAEPQRAKRGPAHDGTGGHTPQQGARPGVVHLRQTNASRRRGSRQPRQPAHPRVARRRHDPIQRLSMAVPTTMSTRNSGSRARRLRIAVVRGRRRSHGQPRQRIMCATAAEQARRNACDRETRCSTKGP